MRFSLSWLRRFIETEADLEKITNALTMAGIEVEKITDPGKELAGLTIAHIRTVARHPDADRLSVCMVDTAQGDKSIVCGAPNVRAGMAVVFAPLGAHLPGLDTPLDAAPRRIRGVASHGMLCSARELCLGDDHDGIIDVAGDHPTGTPAARALAMDDPIIEIEVTPNRPDLLGVVGIARDLAATGIGVFRDDPVSPVRGSFPCPIDIEIMAPAICPAFAGRLIRGVTNRPSPAWLQRRLRAARSTPRNMLVDVTNLLSLERARPLHVYDAGKLNGSVTARTGRDGETLLALDGKTYALGTQNCVIADASGAIGLGGVMGGQSSAVSDTTCDVFIESAWFDPVAVALTGRALNIDSDARRRFERGVDPQSLTDGLERATELILSVCGGDASHIAMVGKPPSGAMMIAFKPADVARLTGVSVPAPRIRHIAHALGMECGRQSDDAPVWSVRAPPWRPDLLASADVVAEIIRIEGFDKIAPVPSDVPPLPAVPSRLANARRCLAARGFTEAVTWSFMDKAKAAFFLDEPDLARTVTNPVAGLDYMRPTILANLVDAVQRNIHRGQTDVRLFEAGPVYPSSDAQHTKLAGVVRPMPRRHWAGAPPVYDSFAIKADCYAVLAELGIDPARMTLHNAAPYWHPGRSARGCLGPHRIAEFGQLHPLVLDGLGVEAPVWAMEVDISALPAARSRQSAKGWTPRPLTPVVRDFAFEVAQDTAAGDIVRAVSASDKTLIARVHVFDVYCDEKLGSDHKSVAIEVVIQPREATLDDAAIEALCQKIVASVAKKTGARLRS